MILYFCSTPYQIMVAINLKLTLHKNKQVDIYILNHFSKAKKITSNLRKTGVFNNVKYINCVDFPKHYSTNRLIRFYQKVKDYLSYKKISKEYFEFKNKVYDEVFLTYPDIIIQLALKELYDRNNNIKIKLFEDGTGGYTSFKISIYKRVFNILFGFQNIIDKYDSLRVFQPELYSGNNNIEVRKIEKIKSNYIKKIINKVFEYESNYNIREKIIFFEQPFDWIENLNNDINSIIREVLEDNYIIKLHPRSKNKEYKNLNLYKNNNLPWEIIALNSNIKNKVLISYYSTASISAKIITDQEPVIIFLYNMKELNNILTDETKLFIQKFIKSYEDKSKIFTPKNIQELQAIINRID